MIRRPPRSTHCISSAASDVYKRQVLQGVTSCTDRVLTQEATCAWRFPDGDGLKAILALCLDAVPSGERCCSSDRLCWHPDQVMRRCGAVGCSDMPEWDVSQVTDAQDLFTGRSSFHQAITGWTFAQGANAAGMFTGADAWLAHSARIDGMNSTDGPPSQWNFTSCLENERVESKLLSLIHISEPTRRRGSRMPSSA